MSLSGSYKAGIIGDALAPNLNEARANQMYLLSEELKVPVLTCNNLGLAPLKRIGAYLVVNTKFLRKRTPILSLLNGAFFKFFVKLFERRLELIFLPGGIESGFLDHLDLKRCVLIINCIPFANSAKEVRNFVQKFAPELHVIIAQGKRIRDKLSEMGVDSEKIQLMYPWVDLDKFKYAEPPSSEEFRILFASAPNDQIPGEDIFELKGIPLLLEAFCEFVKSCSKASLCLVWRGYYDDALYERISELGLENHVKVVNGVADMPRLYHESHLTVIPFLSVRRSPEIPLSAVESLACGRPVIATDVVEIAEIIGAHKCGCIAKPRKEEFVSALAECRRNYRIYQANCRRTAEELFGLDREKFLQICDGLP